MIKAIFNHTIRLNFFMAYMLALESCKKITELLFWFIVGYYVFYCYNMPEVIMIG